MYGLAERFMRVHVSVHCKPDTAAAYRSVLDNHILPALGAMALGEVGRVEVSELRHRLCETPVVANTAVGVLSKMFSLAEAWGLVPPGRNPCRAVRRYRTRECERFLTPGEFRRLGRALKDAEGRMWPPAIAAIRLLTLTGCRRSEILDLRWDDVDRTSGELRLRDAKAGPRMVPLTAAVRKVLDVIPRQPDNPCVIPCKEGEWPPAVPPPLPGRPCGRGRGSMTSGSTTSGIPMPRGRWRLARVSLRSASCSATGMW